MLSFLLSLYPTTSFSLHESIHSIFHHSFTEIQALTLVSVVAIWFMVSSNIVIRSSALSEGSPNAGRKMVHFIKCLPDSIEGLLPQASQLCWIGTGDSDHQQRTATFIELSRRPIARHISGISLCVCSLSVWRYCLSCNELERLCDLCFSEADEADCSKHVNVVRIQLRCR